MKNNHDNNYDKEKRYKLYAPTPIASVKSRDNYAPRANMSTHLSFFVLVIRFDKKNKNSNKR